MFFSISLLLFFVQNTLSQRCYTVDSRSTIYDEVCELLPQEVKIKEGCNVGNQSNCRYCRPGECGSDEGIFSKTTTVDYFEGDILLINKTATDFLSSHVLANSEILQILEEARIVEADMDPLLIVRNALRNKKRTWPNALIPYVIDEDFTPDEKDVVLSAMREIEKETCIKFEQRNSSHPNYVRILKGGGCYSYVGLYGGMQPLSLGRGCIYKGIVMHEIMHTLGFYHEQSRTDRDYYIKINWENILNGTEGNFQKYTQQQIDHLGESYDYFSLLHYTNYAFTKNTKETITPLQPVDLKHSSLKNAPTTTDISKINKLYDCSSKCQDKLENCSSWKEAGYCNNGIFMRLACSVSCFGKCPSLECKDFHISCDWWRKTSQCTEFLRIVCPKSCNQC